MSARQLPEPWKSLLPECVPYAGALDGKGYPSQKEHRKVWVRAHGELLDDWDVHHKCRNPACVNPAHLEALPQRDHDIEHFLTDRGRTLELVRAVRAERASTGAAYRSLAAKYGIPYVTIHDWCNGVAWADMLGAPVVLAPPPRTCPKCLQEFVPPRSNKRFCSANCRSLFNAKLARDAKGAA